MNKIGTNFVGKKESGFKGYNNNNNQNNNNFQKHKKANKRELKYIGWEVSANYIDHRFDFLKLHFHGFR